METTRTGAVLVRRGWPGSAIAVALILGIAAIIGWYEAHADGNEAASANTALQTQTAQNQAMTTRLAATQKTADMAQAAQASLSQAQAALAAEQGKTASLQQQISQMQAQSAQQQASLKDQIAQLKAAPAPPVPSNPPSQPKPADTSALTPPALPAGATGRDYLVAAQQAILAGNPGKAQAALGRAETRYLNGEQLSAGRHNHPQIAEIETALRQLGHHSNDAAIHTLNAMLSRHTT